MKYSYDKQVHIANQRENVASNVTATYATILQLLVRSGTQVAYG